MRARPALAIAMVTVTVGFLAGVQYWRGFFDLSIYFGAVRFWSDGGALYDYLLPETSYGFTYPPFAALAMAPMAVVSWPVVIAGSVLANLGCLALLAYWFVTPIARRRRWTPWFAVIAAACLLALLEPVYDTFSFGQVNLVLMVLVFADARLLAGTTRFRRFGRYAGVGIGLAAALKLTPAIFVIYLVLTGRRRAAAIATGTAAGATLLAAVIAPGTSWTYWTATLWQTERVGSLAYISNQSILGALVRLDPSRPPSTLVWLVLVAAALALWAYHVRRSLDRSDVLTGFALTGAVACLVSPISWVHHLVWLIPGLVLTVDAGLREPVVARRRRLLGAAAAAYLVLCSSLVFLWRFDAGGVDGFLGGSAFTWVALGLLMSLPVVRGTATAALPLGTHPAAMAGATPGHVGPGAAYRQAGSGAAPGREGLGRR
ncbi:glycosyltransferase 87 family protein [Actinopolymorpha sp. B11F2]|uniref:glycosyltransferase 87 family protein n=1 Tax=Actinopolymorpha sp. B11F2 TaxID=3160862 RepID=UPI0032E3F746